MDAQPTTKTDVPARMEAAARAILGHRYRYRDEVQLQDQVAQVLAGAGIEALREFRLSERDRVDFLLPTALTHLDGIAVEVKIKGSRADIIRQLWRYAQHGMVAGILLVTDRALVGSAPMQMLGKPVRPLLLLGGLR